MDGRQDKKGFLFWGLDNFKWDFGEVENWTTPTFGNNDPKMGGGRFELSFIYIDIQLQFGQIPMTAVAV